MKKVKNISAQEWLPINYIYSNGIIKINKNKYIKILKIIPINYNLKSDLEKNSILNSYKIFLKTCDFNIQILIQSNKENLEKHIFNIEKNISQKENNYLNKISKNYINYIKKINSLNKASTKDFYIIICNNINNNYKNNNLKDYFQNTLKKAYHDAYIDDMKNKGYKIKYKKTCDDYLRSFISLFITIGIIILVLQIPFVKNYFYNLYINNPIIHDITNVIINLFNKNPN